MSLSSTLDPSAAEMPPPCPDAELAVMRTLSLTIRCAPSSNRMAPPMGPSCILLGNEAPADGPERLDKTFDIHGGKPSHLPPTPVMFSSPPPLRAALLAPAPLFVIRPFPLNSSSDWAPCTKKAPGPKSPIQFSTVQSPLMPKKLACLTTANPARNLVMPSRKVAWTMVMLLLPSARNTDAPPWPATMSQLALYSKTLLPANAWIPVPSNPATIEKRTEPFSGHVSSYKLCAPPLSRTSAPLSAKPDPDSDTMQSLTLTPPPLTVESSAYTAAPMRAVHSKKSTDSRTICEFLVAKMAPPLPKKEPAVGLGPPPPLAPPSGSNPDIWEHFWNLVFMALKSPSVTCTHAPSTTVPFKSGLPIVRPSRLSAPPGST
mmetsp:Transcript_19204/g.48553  ORF Transcript_19204/g.48553 Transcript_19204/m.48553 type:complete len:374 (-) Transcript_19204:265-1386(-)